MFVEMMKEIKGSGRGEKEKKVVLEERHFRKMDTFDGDNRNSDIGCLIWV